MTSRVVLTIVISKLLDQMLRLETRYVTLTFFWDNFDLCPLEEKSYKLVVLKPGWLILRITWCLKIMDCWFLPHPELVRILRGGTPEYELSKAPVWFWLSARFWNGCFRASQESLNTCWALEPPLNSTTFKMGNLGGGGSLVIQGLRICLSMQGDADLIPGQGTKIPHAAEQLSPHTAATQPPHSGSHHNKKPVHHSEDLAQPNKKQTKKQTKQNKQKRESAFGQMPKAVLVYCDQLTVNTRKRWISGFRLEACILLVQSFIQVRMISHFSHVWVFVTLGL